MQKETPYGEILIEIEGGLLDHDNRVNEGIAEPYIYTDEHFRACLKIFMSGLMWKLWETNDNDIEKMIDLAGKMGEDLKNLVGAYTGINTLDLY